MKHYLTHALASVVALCLVGYAALHLLDEWLGALQQMETAA